MVEKAKGDDDKKGGKDEAAAKQMETLMGAVGTMAKGFETMQSTVKGLTDNVNNLMNVSQQQLDAGKKEDKKEDEPNVDNNTLEQMDRTQFMDVILGKMNKGFEKLSGEIGDKITGVSDNVSTTNLRNELTKVASENPDFEHYKDEMKEIATANPELSISDMFTLVKAKNPQRVEEVDKLMTEQKVEDDKKLADDAAANKTTKGGFGGLTPTSGQRTEKPTNMDQSEAVEDAWAEAMDGVENLVDTG